MNTSTQLITTPTLISSFRAGRYPLTNVNTTTSMLKGIIKAAGEDEFLESYNKYREEHEEQPVKHVTIRRYASIGKGYEKGAPASVLAFSRHLMDELQLEFDNNDDENFFTAPIEEVIATLNDLPQGSKRSAYKQNIIHPKTKAS